ncbi:SMI1/KNR4 family protein [Stigmatella sp. ncwal1]|uniref:SMI1/KNR4 family protein n=1 Tax=Stigmatella ashevillensis TaxID=2995309 RepID=A0ABT5DEK2_9BACT|nr:SMI1/KNR4 family protein [Stigmatella ashevillena]MDC0712058.1 SMI1/KNR4 family protein [Stigmatella ashevillena]
MKELIELLSQYDPSYPRHLRGVSSEELAELERLVGRPLPERLRGFLRLMGRESGDWLSAEVRVRFDAIWQFYLEKERHRLSPRYIFIAAREQSPDRTYFCDCGLLAEAEDCQVVYVRQGMALHRGGSFAFSFPSLKDMLFREAFQSKRMAILPYRAVLRPADRTADYGAAETAAMVMEELADLMPRLGFQRLPQTSALNPLFERGDAALSAHNASDPGDMCVVLATANERERDRLLEALMDTTLLV